MKVIYVDDERSAHTNFYYDLKGREEIEFVEFFFNAKEALAYVEENEINCAFLDIDLAGNLNGIELSKKIKELQPKVEIVFVTAYDDYARDAYAVGACAYLSKPYALEELDTAIDRLYKLTLHDRYDNECLEIEKKVYMKTFGNFDIRIDSSTIRFKTAKAKELLAFLVHQRGGTVSAAQIFMALWENREYTPTTSTYVRRTLKSLRDELVNWGVSEILILNRNCYSVDTQKFHCDFYDLMEGDVEQISQYNGEYMSQYSWGEVAIPLIERKIEYMKKSEN